MTVVNHYLLRERKQDYTCLHLVKDVWKDLTGQDLTEFLADTLAKPSQASARGFRRISDPVNPCLVWFKSFGQSHAGVYIDGKILHMGESATLFQRQADMLGYREVRYYVPINNS